MNERAIAIKKSYMLYLCFVPTTILHNYANTCIYFFSTD